MSDDGEQTTIDNLMKNIMNNLLIEVQVDEDDATQSEFPISMKFTVTNGSSGLPNVVFENVELTVGIPPNMHIERIGRIESGQSYEYKHGCRYIDMPLVQYDLKGNVIPDELFKFETQSKVASPVTPNLSITSYLKAINELEIRKWLEIIPNVVLIPEPHTTLAELKNQENKLGEVILEIRGAEQVLHDLSRFLNLSLNNPMRDRILQHRNLINEFLKEVEHGVSRLRELYRGQPNARNIESTLNKVVNRLSSMAEEIDRATENLRQ